jgi:hypothetical protein
VNVDVPAPVGMPVASGRLVVVMLSGPESAIAGLLVPELAAGLAEPEASAAVSAASQELDEADALDKAGTLDEDDTWLVEVRATDVVAARVAIAGLF